MVVIPLVFLARHPPLELDFTQLRDKSQRRHKITTMVTKTVGRQAATHFYVSKKFRVIDLTKTPGTIIQFWLIICFGQRTIS